MCALDYTHSSTFPLDSSPTKNTQPRKLLHTLQISQFSAVGNDLAQFVLPPTPLKRRKKKCATRVRMHTLFFFLHSPHIHDLHHCMLPAPTHPSSPCFPPPPPPPTLLESSPSLLPPKISRAPVKKTPLPSPLQPPHPPTHTPPFSNSPKATGKTKRRGTPPPRGSLARKKEA